MRTGCDQRRSTLSRLLFRPNLLRHAISRYVMRGSQILKCCIAAVIVFGFRNQRGILFQQESWAVEETLLCVRRRWRISGRTWIFWISELMWREYFFNKIRRKKRRRGDGRAATSVVLDFSVFNSYRLRRWGYLNAVRHCPAAVVRLHPFCTVHFSLESFIYIYICSGKKYSQQK